VFQDRQNNLQILHRAFGTAQQVDDQSFLANARNNSLEHRVRGNLQTRRAHRFGEAGRVASGLTSRGEKPVPPAVRITSG